MNSSHTLFDDLDNQSGVSETDISEASPELRRSPASCCQELEKLKQSYAYVCADLDNVRRRAERECVARVKTSSIHMLKDVLAIVDDMTKLSEDIQHPALDMILRKADAFMRSREIQEVPASGVFNPELHQEAIAQIPALSPEQVGTIAQVVQKGYTYQGTLIRPAHVVVYAAQ